MESIAQEPSAVQGQTSPDPRYRDMIRADASSYVDHVMREAEEVAAIIEPGMGTTVTIEVRALIEHGKTAACLSYETNGHVTEDGWWLDVHQAYEAAGMV